MINLLKTWTVLFALSLAFNVQANESDSLQQEITEGKIQASYLTQAMDIQTQSAELISNIQFVQDMVGTSVEDSDGLLKALGEKEFFATLEKQKLDAVVVKMQSLSTEQGLAEGLRRVRGHLEVILKLNQEARQLVK